MLPTDLETLREIFKDKRLHIAIAQIKQLSLVDDRSCLKCLVLMFDGSETDREIVARMSWDAVGPSCGVFQFPSIGDLVLIGFAEGAIEQAFVIRRLTSLEDKIPLQAVTGDTAIVTMAGKKAWLSSDTRINLSKGTASPSENLVLGQQLKTLLANILTKLADLSDKVSLHTHSGNLGYPTSPPNTAAQFTALKGNFDSYKASPVNDSAILSDLAFTEKGT